MAAAGIEATLLPASRFSPGVEHRRVVWAHMRAHNPRSVARTLAWAASAVCSLHTFSAAGVEFRQRGTGRLVAFSATTVGAHGGYSCGVVWAALPEVARAGLWLTNMRIILEHLLLAGRPLGGVRVFDVGPTLAALKRTAALRALGFRATLRAAAWG